jgi:hypothetical protein
MKPSSRQPSSGKSRLILVFSALLLSSCASSNPSDALQHELKTLISWIETTRTVGQAWQSGSVPSAYAARTFQTAQEALQEESETIQSLSIAEVTKADLRAGIQQMQNSLGQAVVNLKNGDRAGVGTAMTELTTAEQVLNSGLKQGSGPTRLP